MCHKAAAATAKLGLGQFRFLKNRNFDSLGVLMRWMNLFHCKSGGSQFLFVGNRLPSRRNASFASFLQSAKREGNERLSTFRRLSLSLSLSLAIATASGSGQETSSNGGKAERKENNFLPAAYIATVRAAFGERWRAVTITHMRWD